VSGTDLLADHARRVISENGTLRARIAELEADLEWLSDTDNLWDAKGWLVNATSSDVTVRDAIRALRPATASVCGSKDTVKSKGSEEDGREGVAQHDDSRATGGHPQERGESRIEDEGPRGGGSLGPGHSARVGAGPNVPGAEVSERCSSEVRKCAHCGAAGDVEMFGDSLKCMDIKACIERYSGQRFEELARRTNEAPLCSFPSTGPCNHPLRNFDGSCTTCGEGRRPCADSAKRALSPTKTSAEVRRRVCTDLRARALAFLNSEDREDEVGGDHVQAMTSMLESVWDDAFEVELALPREHPPRPDSPRTLGTADLETRVRRLRRILLDTAAALGSKLSEEVTDNFLADLPHEAKLVRAKADAPRAETAERPDYPCCEAVQRLERTTGLATTLEGGLCPIHGISLVRRGGEP
jgi:hypothetical protein